MDTRVCSRCKVQSPISCFKPRGNDFTKLCIKCLVIKKNNYINKYGCEHNNYKTNCSECGTYKGSVIHDVKNHRYRAQHYENNKQICKAFTYGKKMTEEEAKQKAEEYLKNVYM